MLPLAILKVGPDNGRRMPASVTLRRSARVLPGRRPAGPKLQVGYQLVELYDAYVKFLRERTHSKLMNLNLTQWRTLTLIRFNPHQTQRALALAVGIDPSSMTPIIAFLERKSWVARRRSRKNRSAFHVSMTPAGLRVYRQVERELGRSEKLFATALGTSRYLAMLQLLGALQRRLADELAPLEGQRMKSSG